MRKSINLFMWGFQPHFRSSLEYGSKEILKALNLDEEPEAFLIGVKRPKTPTDYHEACIEPEDGAWPLSLLEGLQNSVETILKNHPRKDMLYGDALTMEEKPESLRRDSVRTAVENLLQNYNSGRDVEYFCGGAVAVDHYHVVPVLEIPRRCFAKFPKIKTETYKSFLHACLMEFLHEASKELAQPMPGRSISRKARTTPEITSIAARSFTRNIHSLIDKQFWMHKDLFDSLNLISSLFYEGSRFSGSKVILASENDPNIDYYCKFETSAPLSDARWARKILQMASNNTHIISDGRSILGLGKLRSADSITADNIFIVDFFDFYHWQILNNNQVLLKCGYGRPLPTLDAFDEESFVDNYNRIFSKKSDEDAKRLWRIIEIARSQEHGSMIVVAEDAQKESIRLNKQGTQIIPQLLTDELFLCASKIDGSIILDSSGVCYSIGVILDGQAVDDCTPSRGSRFNSGIRYVNANPKNRLALIFSEDKTMDILPTGPKRISRRIVEEQVSLLEKSNKDNFHRCRNWLNDHRFYLNSSQCKRINASLERINNEPREIGEIQIAMSPFTVHENHDDTYFKD